MAQPQLDVDHFRRRLEDMRQSLQNELASLDAETVNVDQSDSYGIKNHPAEDATELFTRERGLAIEAQLQREIQQIDHALELMNAGSYGICEVGGEPIPIERLEARPLATLCIQHQRERDEQEGGTTRTVG
ncbi:MAG TPA: TraR/DksA C4-type zinc finger protein [Herpetosiphonaceae bacterium]